ncbi:MAG: PIG-L family deacetylase, partial [Chloroflexota bacterium]
MVIKPIIQVTSKKFLALFWLIMLSQANLYRRLRRVPRVKRKDFPALSLQGVERVLIIAPHPDDETIGAGGLIQAARSRGAEVRVVIVTNGDGQAFAPLALNHCLLPRTKDYVALGERRQKETVNALGLLGLVQEDVHFLGYPDRQLATLWAANWTSDFPL